VKKQLPYPAAVVEKGPGYVAIGGMQLALAVSLALAFRYYQARSAALARLDAIAAELEH